MKLIGLTGGIGMGKSTAFELLQRRGIPAVDTDRIARELVEPGSPALDEIAAHFGPDLLEAGGRLNRRRLGERIFGDPTARRQLESILHPAIRKSWLALAETWREAGVTLGVVVIPLLFETGAESHFDAIFCVACRPETQLHRLRQRDWSETHARQRIQSQWDIARKMDHSNYVVWTEGDFESHAEQIDCLLARL